MTERAQRFLFLGIVNTAMPFCLLAYSTLSLEAGFTALLNATTPMFAAMRCASAKSVRHPIRHCCRLA